MFAKSAHYPSDIPATEQLVSTDSDVLSMPENSPNRKID